MDALRWIDDVEAPVALLLLILGAGFVALAWRLMRRRSPRADDRLWRDLALLVALGIVAIATLLTTSDGGEPPQLRLHPFANLINASRDHGSIRGALAEMLANVLLFVPLGLALGWRFPALGVLRITRVTLALSVGIEVAQALAAGRTVGEHHRRHDERAGRDDRRAGREQAAPDGISRGIGAGSQSACGSPHLRLVGPLGGLVLGERLGRVDVAERRVVRHDLLDPREVSRRAA